MFLLARRVALSRVPVLFSNAVQSRPQAFCGLSGVIVTRNYAASNARRLRRRMAMQPLTAADGPLVWVDCEMTGLDPTTDRILEIAVVITNGDLTPVDDGLEFIVKTDKSVLDGMGEWCTEQHGKTGLTQACLDSPHTLAHVHSEVLKYVKKWVPEQRTAPLAGNSVHADRAFLVKEMPEVMDWLHYRIVDVSSVKELSFRWFPDKTYPKRESGHRALDDIRGSIEELQWYRRNIFVMPSSRGARSSQAAPTFI